MTDSTPTVKVDLEGLDAECKRRIEHGAKLQSFIPFMNIDARKLAALIAEVRASRAGGWKSCAEPPNHSRTVTLRYGEGNQAVTGFYSPGDGRWMRFKSAGLCEPLPAYAESSWYLELPDLPSPPRSEP